MNPILYKETEEVFSHNGLGALSEAVLSHTTEVGNGELENETVYLADGILANEIENGRFLKIKPNDLDDLHIFEIYDHVLDTVSNTITIFSHSITNQLGSNLVKNAVVKNGTGQDAMNAIKANLIEPTRFDLVSDISTRSSTEWENRNPLNCIAGEEGSLIQYWGGQVKRDNRTIYLLKKRGRDKVGVIREGRDIKGLTIEYSLKGLVTKILPFRKYVPDGKEEEVTEYGDIVTSQYDKNYPYSRIVPIDYSSEEGINTLSDLNSKASRYFVENNGIDKPRVNVVLDMIELSDSSFYSEFKKYEKVGMFDSVEVYSKIYNLKLNAQVNKIIYDSLAERNISVEIGNFRTGLIESVEKEYKDFIKDRDKELVNVVQRAANGKNKIFRGVTMPTKGMATNDLWYKPVGDGETELYRFTGSSWSLEKVSAGLLGGTLDATNGDIDLINVNVHSLVGNISEFIKTYWNAINSRADIDGNRLRFTHTNGSETLINAQGLIHREGGTNYETNYLFDIITVTGLNNFPSSQRWVTLPSIYKGKRFKAVAVLSDAYGHTESPNYNRLNMQRVVCFVDHPNIDYTNARVPVVGYVYTRDSVSGNREFWPIQVQVLVQY